MKNINVNKISFPFIKLNQPGGEMYLGKMKAIEIDALSKINRISLVDNNAENIQRNENKRRVKDISDYAERKDAVFPTPIILSGDSKNVNIDENIFTFNDNAKESFSIIDGQHRLLGIKESAVFEELELPVVIFLDTEPYEDAMIFITINGNQVKVPMSIIYQLFGIMPGRSIDKTCHVLTKLFNENEDSPFFNKIKMLGTKTEDQDFAPLSQSSFITPIKPLIKNGIFTSFYENEKDSVIYKILFNYFSAVARAFKNDWDNPESMIPKAIGHKALIDLLSKRLFKEGQEAGKMTEDFFYSKLSKISSGFDSIVTSNEYGSSYGGATKLYMRFIEILDK